MLKRTTSSYFPDLGSNAVIQLIIALGVAFVTLGLVQAIMWITHFAPMDYDRLLSYIALGSVHQFPSRFWTLFTFGLFNGAGFFALLSNMIWLYCFGSLVQMLIGYKQVIPIFLYSMVAGGVFYLLCQLLPGNIFVSHVLLRGPEAGIIGLGAAALTLSPQYRFYFTPTFSVPLYVIACIFAFFMVLNTGMQLPLLFQLVGGGLMGFGYVKLLRSGYKPGDWIYNMYDNMQRSVTPDDHVTWGNANKKRSQILKNMQRNGTFSQNRIDDILDKINQKGYNSLSTDEKEILMRASRENQ